MTDETPIFFILLGQIKVSSVDTYTVEMTVMRYCGSNLRKKTDGLKGIAQKVKY